MKPADLADHVADVQPLTNGLILGGTRVHDWFLAHKAIHQVNLTIEPVTFGKGLPVFSDAQQADPVENFTSQGFEIEHDERLNSAGTRYLVLRPGERP